MRIPGPGNFALIHFHSREESLWQAQYTEFHTLAHVVAAKGEHPQTKAYSLKELIAGRVARQAITEDTKATT